MGFQIRLKDIFDIILVAILLYQTYKLLKDSGAVSVFIGILGFVIAWFLVSFVFELELMGAIFDRVISVGAIALIVVFQEEIKRFFSRIGNRKSWRFIHKISFRFKPQATQKQIDRWVIQIVLACKNMSKSKTGALIVISNRQALREFIQSGERMDAIISSRLIENIFFKNSPLHDGAMLIADGKVLTAGSILPISKQQNIPKNMGLRHRAALGVVEKIDAIAVVVSEETGRISCAYNNTIQSNIKPEQLELILSGQMSIEAE